MRKFFASCFGFLIAWLIFFIGGAIALALIFKSDTEINIEEQSILHIKIDGEISEQIEDNPLENIMDIKMLKSSSISLTEFKKAIEYAKKDHRIEGIYLDVQNLQAGFASINEMRQSLIDFKQSKKWIIAYGTHFSLGSYYLATGADKIYMYPEGDITFTGLSMQVTFFKKMFDKLNIKPEVFRVGDYKGAVEPFIRENLSDENKFQLNEILQSVYKELLTNISTARNIPIKKLKTISDNVKIRTPKDAVKYGFITDLLYKDQLEDVLKKHLNLDEEKDIKTVKYNVYKNDVLPTDDAPTKDQIAVVIVEGEIQEQKKDDLVNNTIANSYTLIKTIRKAQENEDVKAIVIRIKSPGGSFIASDKIWRAIKLAAEKKPVIASMSDYAASGGYFLAVACHTIVAQPTTITGSIGVFSMFFDASPFFNTKIGITTEELKTGQLGRITPMQPLTPFIREMWQTQVDSIYNTFIAKVAEGRKNMNEDDVRNVASGRVWTGRQAKENGLVDVLGTYNDAIDIAAKKAGIEKYTVRHYPKSKNTVTKILNMLQSKISSTAIMQKIQLGEWYPLYQQWKKIETRRGVQALMPYRLETQETHK